MKKIIFVLLMILPVSGYSFGYATLPEQILQEITALDQLSQQVNMVQQQLQMVQNQARNLQGLPMQMWPNVSSQLQTLFNLVGQAQGLSYSSQNLAAQVQQQYGDPGSTLPNYENSLQQWTRNLNSQVASTLQQYGMQAQNFQTEQGTLQALENASQSSTGRLQALQAGNAIAGMQVNQLQLLRQTMMSGNQAMLNAIANKSNQNQQDRNAVKDWLATPPSHGW